LARQQGDELTVTLPTLKKRLHENKVLVATDARGGKLRYDVRHILDGKRRAVLHLSAAALEAEEVAQVAQDRKTTGQSEDFRWATMWATRVSSVAQGVSGKDGSTAAPGGAAPVSAADPVGTSPRDPRPLRVVTL